jgi:glycine cleavage system H protein
LEVEAKAQVEWLQDSVWLSLDLILDLDLRQRGACMIPKDLRYHQEHEWVRVSGTQATVGISHFAQDSLGDIVFIDLPKPGAVVKAGQQIGEVESTKTTSTIYTPVSGTIAKGNAELKDHPEVVNSDPYGKGWMVVIDLSSANEVDKLMTAAQYEVFLAGQKH